MLFEVAQAFGSDSEFQSSFSIKIQNIIKAQIEFQFFSTEEPTNQPFDTYMKETLLSVVEKTSEDTQIKQNFEFLLAKRLLTDFID